MPNILVLFTDQWRGDCLSIEGHPVVETPFIDRWAAGARRFTRAYSANPTCVPARASLMTGQRAQTHGRVGYRDGVPWDYETTLAGEFTRHGYRTHAIGKMHVYPERHPLGFESVELHDGYLHFARGHAGDLAEVDDYVPWLREVSGRADADYAEHGVDCNSTVARPWDKPEWQHPTNWVTQRAVEFLRTHDRDRPFFLFASYHRPHPPYDPPAWAFEQYLAREMPPPPVGAWTRDMWRESGDPHDPTSPYLELPEHRLHRARAGYYGHMSHIDQQVNRIFEVLLESRARETIVLFASDHGELMGDHHLFRKSLPYEGSARIPFVLSGPGVEPGVDDRVVELRDIMPTLLTAAGLPVPESVEGRDVLGGPRRELLHGEHVEHVLDTPGSVHWLTDGRWKYVWRSGDGREQLFDLQTDPDELNDRAGDVAPWRKLLTERLTGRPEGFVAGGELVTGRPVMAVLPVCPGRGDGPGQESS
ncbi:arylsulfatase [Nonomuraea antri]|uniref:arylsulfatase n=1 Tax=Nonomuraea antri TaxID=2730852 RepID=UPI001567CDA7|nr:arylsulfatase [Nonomuraea antri]